MRPLVLPFVILFLALPSAGSAQTVPLNNRDILQMVEAGLSSETVIAKIKVSQTNFDTSPAALAELKSKGIPEAVLLAMIGTPVPVTVENNDAESRVARENAIKALRRLANGVEVGVSYVEYGPLVAEAKTELETALAKLPSDGFKQSALRAMREYQFAATVWQIYWRDDFVGGSYKDIAVNEYGVQKRGWLKVVWRSDFLAAIWSEARRYYEAALNPDAKPERVVDIPPTPAQQLSGVWRLQLTGTSETWILTVQNRKQSLGELRDGSSDYLIHGIALASGTYTLRSKKGDLSITATINGDKMTGSIIRTTQGKNLNTTFTGQRTP